jgi:hypothetical protein
MRFELAPWAETPWGALFASFDVSKSIELIGRDTVQGRRSVRLRVLRDPDDLARLADQIQPAPVTAIRESPVSYETVHVLELQCEQGEGIRTYVMILGPDKPAIRPVPPPPPFPAVFLAARKRIGLEEDAERFAKLQLTGQEDVVLNALRQLEPRLSRLAMVVLTGGLPVIHGDIGLPKLVPLPDMGEGMARLASLVLAVGYAAGGAVLVDEIENGLHYSVLSRVWQVLSDAARQFDVQVFATTHSRECIVSAHQAFSGTDMYDFRFHRLERVEGRIRAVTYPRETLEAAIETRLEVR